MGIEVKVESNVGKVLDALPEQIAQALEAIGIAAENNAVKEVNKAVYDTPESKSGYVRTGRLRDSITHAVDAGEQCAIIGSNVEYAAHVELGTSKMKARPYLRPAVADYGDEYKSLADAVLRGGRG